MEVKILYTCDDYYQREKLLVDGKEMMSVHDLSECPEDAIIGRDLNCMYDTANLMQLAYEAGKRGESFNIIYNEVDEEEYESYE